MPNFEKFVPLRKQRVSMKRKAISKAKKIAPVRLVRTSNCPYQKEFDAMRDQFVEQALHTKELAELHNLRRLVACYRTMCMAAHEEIKDVWEAHCDPSSGLGPANLMARLSGKISPDIYPTHATDDELALFIQKGGRE